MLSTIEKLIEKLAKKLRSPLSVGEIVFVLFSRLEKKMYFLYFIKAQSKVSNKKKRFLITRRFENYGGTEFYSFGEVLAEINFCCRKQCSVK